MTDLKATFIKDLKDFNGHAALFRCTPGGPLPEYVVVSAIDAMFTGPETYIFAADSDGNVTNWGELDGSFRGSKDIDRALGGAGYTVEGL